MRADSSVELRLCLVTMTAAAFLLAGCGGSPSEDIANKGSADAGPDAEKPNVATPTGALSFGLIGDGRDGCGGKDAAKACSTSLAILYQSTATLRIRGTATHPG